MARSPENGSARIYELAAQFQDRCLLDDGSILFEDQRLWTPQNLDTLHRVFVAEPDEGDRSFIEKFHDQLQLAGPEVIKLAAEVLAIYFLFPSSVGGPRKRELVNEVLSWAEDGPMADDHPLALAFNTGIGSGGQGYNTRRPFELAFLIDVAIALKTLPGEERERALADPWTLQRIADEQPDAEARQLRHMLLNLLFPEEFERIASGNHKRRVISAFSELLAGPAENPDRQLLEIRRALEDLLPRRDLDFYEPPLVTAWYDSAEGSDDLAPIELVHHKKQIVFFGPPGTGKTFTAKALAKQIIRGAAMRRMGPARYFREQQLVDAAVDANVHRLQLHPAYSYEDFIRALHIGSGGVTDYRMGYLPTLIATMEASPAESRLPHVLILDEMNRTDLSRMLGECFSLLEDRGEAVDLPGGGEDGAPVQLKIPDDLYIIGTMNLIDQSIEQIDFALRRRFLWVLCQFDRTALLDACRAKWEARTGGPGWERVAADFEKLADAAAKLNSAIADSDLLGPQYEVGHTYFMDVVSFLSDTLGQRPRFYLWRRDEALLPVQQLWRLSLKPLLDQYLSGLEKFAREQELLRLQNAFLRSSQASG